MDEALFTPAEIVDQALKTKPELIIHSGNLPSSVEALRNLLAKCGRLFERGGPVRFGYKCGWWPASSGGSHQE
jgi:hypothetical protein